MQTVGVGGDFGELDKMQKDHMGEAFLAASWCRRASSFVATNAWSNRLTECK
jgi:hypothetical protein